MNIKCAEAYTLSELVLREKQVRQLNEFCAVSRRNSHVDPYQMTIDDIINAWAHQLKVKSGGITYERIKSIKLTIDADGNSFLQLELLGSNDCIGGYSVIVSPKNIEIA